MRGSSLNAITLSFQVPLICICFVYIIYCFLIIEIQLVFDFSNIFSNLGLIKSFQLSLKNSFF